MHAGPARRARSAATPRLKHIVVTLGGDVVRVNPTSRYAGPGGDVELLGAVLRRRRPAPGAPAVRRPRRRRTAAANVDLQGRAAGRRRAHGLGRRRADPRRAPRAPTPTSSTATWCSPTAPAPTRCRTSRSRPARSSAPGTPAPPAGSTTSSCSTCRPAASPRTRPAASSCAASSPSIVQQIGVPELEERLHARHRGRARDVDRRGSRGGRVSDSLSFVRRRLDAPARGRRGRASSVDGVPRRGRARQRRRRARHRRHLHPRRRLARPRARSTDCTHRVLAARLALRPAHRQAHRPCRPSEPGPRLPRDRSTATTCYVDVDHPSTRANWRRRPCPPWRSATCTSRVETEEGTKEILRGVDLTDPRRRDPRDHGPQRLRQVDAGVLDRRPPEVHGHRAARSRSTARTSSR